MRGSLEIPDTPSLILPSLVTVSSDIAKKVEEIGGLTKAIFTDPNGLRTLCDINSHEATVEHRLDPNTKLKARVFGKSTRQPAKDPRENTRFKRGPRIIRPTDRVMTVEGIEEITLAIIEEDVDTECKIKVVDLPTIDFEDPFLEMILDSFRSHVSAA